MSPGCRLTAAATSALQCDTISICATKISIPGGQVCPLEVPLSWLNLSRWLKVGG